MRRVRGPCYDTQWQSREVLGIGVVTGGRRSTESRKKLTVKLTAGITRLVPDPGGFRPTRCEGAELYRVTLFALLCLPQRRAHVRNLGIPHRGADSNTGPQHKWRCVVGAASVDMRAAESRDAPGVSWKKAIIHRPPLLYGAQWQPDDREGWEAVGDVGLDLAPLAAPGPDP